MYLALLCFIYTINYFCLLLGVTYSDTSVCFLRCFKALLCVYIILLDTFKSLSNTYKYFETLQTF